MPIKPTTRDTGIYRVVNTRAEPHKSGKPDVRAMRTLFDKFAAQHNRSFADRVAILEKKACEILRKYTGDFGDELRRSDKPPHLLPDPFPVGTSDVDINRAKDAREIMWEIFVLRDLLGKGDTEHALRSALRLGTLAARIDVRPFEPDVVRGKGVTKRAKAANEARAEAYATMAASYQPRVDEEMQGGKVSHTAACKRAAEHFKVHWRTIFDNTADTFKKPKARRKK